MEILLSDIQAVPRGDAAGHANLQGQLARHRDVLKDEASQPAVLAGILGLDPAAHTLGVAHLLAAHIGSEAFAWDLTMFTFTRSFLLVADADQVARCPEEFSMVAMGFSKQALAAPRRVMLSSLTPLLSAVLRLRPTPDTLTPVHTELLLLCLKSQALPFAKPVLDQPIFDIVPPLNSGRRQTWARNAPPRRAEPASASAAAAGAPSRAHVSQPPPAQARHAVREQMAHAQVTAESYLAYFYYGGVLRIGLKQYASALRLLLTVLCCPSNCLSQVQVDAYKKCALVSLKVRGEVLSLPVYTSSVVLRLARCPSYVSEIEEAWLSEEESEIIRVVENNRQEIELDGNIGLVKQVVAARVRHKIQRLTQTYLTMSFAEIAREIGRDESRLGEVEALVFEMIASGEICARVDQRSQSVDFEEEDEASLDAKALESIQERLVKIMALAQRVSCLEREVVASEPYTRKKNAAEAVVPGVFEFVDM